ncbi:hypothetical protein MKK58_03770 [Methylobacterium sp. J-078]|uniref:hypothetical protein n=1 Tax=Methylobacterium sp. J-078 TaxID=2836657 RepID=UPI001FBAB5A8|nr:hypothetical protein [Methylobacterium sp. J-078]MCJ2043655.1 hypothetical protein [Methylobacterium sp. J-078]
MSIALFALAAVMIVGGIISVIQGFPFVRLESGLAMTIAGATTASAGAVLLGLAVIARRLGALAQVLREAPRAEAAPVQAAESELSASLRQRPSLAVTAAGLGALGGAGLGAATTLRSGREPTFFDPAPPPPAPEAAAAEPLLPNLLPEEDAAAQPSEPHREESHPEGPHPEVPPQPEAGYPEFHQPAPPVHQPEEEMLFGAPAPEAPQPEPEPEPVVLRPALAEPEPVAQEPVVEEPVNEPVAHQPEPEPVAPAPVEAPQPEPEPPSEPERQVVGTYASGGNTYVMFSTGVIEAETPRGRYTFASLDELKAFVEAGGETDARGAA